jgi:hypothetical protein
LTVRQNYIEMRQKMAVQLSRYAHANQYKRMRASVKTL